MAVKPPRTGFSYTDPVRSVGGGLGGFAVAGRLSEDPSVTVLLLEAGNDDRDNPDIYDIYNFGSANGSLVWNWKTDLNKTIQG